MPLTDPMELQDGILDGADGVIQRKAALDGQAAALRAKMKESHLAIFRSEAKNRQAPNYVQFQRPKENMRFYAREQYCGLC